MTDQQHGSISKGGSGLAPAPFTLTDQRYREIFKDDVSANLILDPHMFLLEGNRAAALLFGFEDRPAMMARSVAGEFPCRSDRETICNEVEQSPVLERHPLLLHRQDGTTVLAVGTCAGNRDQAGALRYIHCHLAESTDRRRAERKITRLSAELLHAQNEERRRLSHDLHDSAGQTLSALGMNLGLLEAKWPKMPDGASAYLAECKELVQECVRNIRTVSYSLHPPLLEELGIGAALSWYVEGFSSRSAISVTVETSDDLGRLDTEVETALFRIVQEALTNVHRHSGSKTAQVRAWREPQEILLTISDQGRGISANKPAGASAPTGIGLASIRQQLSLIGGYLEIFHGPGTTLRVCVPRFSQEQRQDPI